MASPGPVLCHLLDEIQVKINVVINVAIGAQNLVEFDDLRTEVPENFQENPLLKAGYSYYRPN